MRDAADRAELGEERRDGFGAIVSDLISLVEHVQASIRLIETAIARESLSADEDAANVVVLDDVTPHYVKANHVLNACRASLGTTLQFLLDASFDAGTPAQGALRLSAHG